MLLQEFKEANRQLLQDDDAGDGGDAKGDGGDEKAPAGKAPAGKAPAGKGGDAKKADEKPPGPKPSEHKSSETFKDSEKPTYKSESKVTGKWSHTSESKHTPQGKATYKSEKKNPEKVYESSYKSDFKGPDNKVEGPKHTYDKDGNKIFVFKTGKRAFEYTESSSHVVNFGSHTASYSGGTPAMWEHKSTLTAPIKESKTTYSSGAGPSYEHKWSYTSGTHGRRWVVVLDGALQCAYCFGEGGAGSSSSSQSGSRTGGSLWSLVEGTACIHAPPLDLSTDGGLFDHSLNTQTWGLYACVP